MFFYNNKEAHRKGALLVEMAAIEAASKTALPRALRV